MSSCKEKNENNQAQEESKYTYTYNGTLDGWRNFNQDTLSSKWEIRDGAIYTDGQNGGDIVFTGFEFGEFELSLDWKIGAGGNSGIMYHIQEGNQYNAPYETGPEYQLIDEIGFAYPLEDWQKTGVDYGMYTGDIKGRVLKPAGEWNQSVIRFTNELVTHHLNGHEILQFVPWSEDWYERKNKGKWKDYPDYGEARSGLIGLQDHDSPIWFQKIDIKEL